MASNNIFDTRNILKETPKISNRFLLTAQSDQLSDIIFGRSESGTKGNDNYKSAISKSKLFRHLFFNNNEIITI
jgi:hypothetical protein